MPTRVLLLRHGTPVPKEEDSEQPLSTDGVAEAVFTAHAVAACVGLDSKFGKPTSQAQLDVIVTHSGKARAEQTAGILCDTLVLGGAKLLGNAADAESLAPNADPTTVLELMGGLVVSQETLLVLVGHLPSLHRVAEALGVQATAEQFTPAGGLLLQRGSAVSAWSLEAVVDKTSWWMEAPPPPP